jgi:predicted methyltransferase
LKDALRPGGTLAIVDFERIPGISRQWILDHVRAGKEVTRSEIEQAGFEFIDEPHVEGLSENYMILFRRPSTVGVKFSLK